MSVYYRSVLKGPPSEDTLLSLTTEHYLSILPKSSNGLSSISPKATRLRATALPNVLDVTLASSSLRLDITARYNNETVPECDILCSALIRELLRFMRRVRMLLLGYTSFSSVLTISPQHGAIIGLEACSGPVSNDGLVSCTYTNFRRLSLVDV